MHISSLKVALEVDRGSEADFLYAGYYQLGNCVQKLEIILKLYTGAFPAILYLE